MRSVVSSKKDFTNDTLEKGSWAAAGQLRANSGHKCQEYSAPVLGLEGDIHYGFTPNIAPSGRDGQTALN